MTPEDVQAKKKELDARLVGGDGKTIISVAFGLELFSELCRTGDIQWGEFGNMAHRLKVEGAPRRLTLPAYGQSGLVHAINRASLPPDGFQVGLGGYEA